MNFIEAVKASTAGKHIGFMNGTLPVTIRTKLSTEIPKQLTPHGAIHIIITYPLHGEIKLKIRIEDILSEEWQELPK